MQKRTLGKSGLEECVGLEEASSAITVEGEQYPATHAKLIDRLVG